MGSAYGAAGSLVVFLFWIYYSAQIFLFGAEWIKVQKRMSEADSKHRMDMPEDRSFRLRMKEYF